MTRTSHWDRPPAPKDVRWFVRLVGKILIGTGLLMFGFVAYQLWGTGIEYARAQNRAEGQFEEMMAAASTLGSTSSTTTTTSTTATTTTRPPTTAPAAVQASTTSSTSSSSTTTSTTTSTTASSAPTTTVADFTDTVAAMNITDGEAFARLEIASIGLDTFVFPGVTRDDLKLGPGHFPNTPMPGQLGNSALAGHRTTYGQPFRNVDQIVPGDEIIVTLPYGRFVYVMTSSEIVAPSDTHVIATTDPTVANLTLTSCHPVFSASERYIVFAELDLTQSPAPGLPIYNYGRDQAAPVAVGLPGDETLAETTTPTSTTTATTATTTSVPPESTSPLASGETIVTSNTATTSSTTTEAPVATAAPDTLYNVGPGLGLEGGGGSNGDDGGGASIGGDGEAFSNRWFSDKDALPQVAMWAVACTAIVVGAYQLAKLLRNSWIGLAAGILPFLVALYFFYENVNRLLPAAL